MFIPCKETILDMTPTEFEKHSLRVLTEQLQNIENCIFQHDKIIEVDDGNYQIDGYIEFDLWGLSIKHWLSVSIIKQVYLGKKLQCFMIK